MSVFDYFRPAKMPDPNRALPGRPDPIEKPGTHCVLGTPLAGPWPDGTRTAVFAFGCFWGAERITGSVPASSRRPSATWAVSPRTRPIARYAPARPATPRPCSSPRPSRISYEELLKVFWESHDPTQAMRQGNDVGTQYRSLIQVSNDEERRIAEASRNAYQEMLKAAGYGEIMTRSPSARRSSTPRTTTSSTSTRCRTATARSMRPASSSQTTSWSHRCSTWTDVGTRAGTGADG